MKVRITDLSLKVPVVNCDLLVEVNPQEVWNAIFDCYFDFDPDIDMVEYGLREVLSVSLEVNEIFTFNKEDLEKLLVKVIEINKRLCN